jgi:hypothetical protein
VFHRCAVERFGLDPAVPATKTAVRAGLRALPEGERRWIELQGLVYGRHIEEAVAAPGVLAFFATCEARDVDVSIISHKTESAVSGSDLNLRGAARNWLRTRGLDGEAGDARVFFEETRERKLRRIADEGCSIFVDDLEEVLEEPGFPEGVARWLYAPGRPGGPRGLLRVFPSWAEITSQLLAVIDERRG